MLFRSLEELQLPARLRDAVTEARRISSFGARRRQIQYIGRLMREESGSEEIRRRIEAGESDARIRAYFVDLYGESVLLKPQGTGIGLIVWALPVAAVILAGAALVLALRRWKRAPRLSSTPEDEALVARALEREHGGEV